MLTYTKKEIKGILDDLIVFNYNENEIVHNIWRHSYTKELLWSMKRFKKNGHIFGILIVRKK